MRETLGKVGVLSFEEARGEAKRRRAEHTLGKELVASIRWEDAVALFLVEVERNCKPTTHSNYEFVLRRYFRLGRTVVSKVTPHDVTRPINRSADMRLVDANSARRILLSAAPGE